MKDLWDSKYLQEYRSHQVIRHFLDQLFPGERILESVPFRITRNADLSVREDLAADLMAEMEQVIDKKKEAT